MADADEIRVYLASYPDNHDQRWRLARKLYEQREYTPALAELLRLKAVWPDHVPLQRYLGATHYRLGHFTEASTVLEIAVARNPGDILLLEQLAKTYEGAGRRHHAIDTWKLVLKFDASPRAVEALERLGIAENTPAPGALAGTLQELSTHGDDTLMNCPHCGEPNDMFSERCWRCHGDFSAPATSPIPPVQAPPAPALTPTGHRVWVAVAVFTAIATALLGAYDALSGRQLLGPWIWAIAFLPCVIAGIVLALALRWRHGSGGGDTGTRGFARPTEGAPWSGWRRFRVHKRITEDAAGHLCSIYLTPENRRRLPGYEPGQYVLARIEMPDPKYPERMRDCIRPYYLCDSPNGRYYRICVERVPCDTQTSGSLSNFLIDEVRKGAIIELEAPTGHCPLDLERSEPLALIGMGAGIAPMLAVCSALLDRQSTRPVYFLYEMRDESELSHVPNFAYAASHLPHARIQLCFSESMPTGTVDGTTTGDGVVYRKGRISTALVKQTVDLATAIWYICGAGAGLDHLASDLEALGVPPERIHRASFTA